MIKGIVKKPFDALESNFSLLCVGKMNLTKLLLLKQWNARIFFCEYFRVLFSDEESKTMTPYDGKLKSGDADAVNVIKRIF